MRIIKVSPSGFASNSYILTEDGKNAVVIDAAQPRIADILSENGLCCRYVLLTHGHFDHIGGCAVLHEKGAVICCGEHEKDLIFGNEYLNMFGWEDVAEFSVSRTFSDSEEFTLCGISFKAVCTPGHSAGSMCYIAERNIFSGDTLFYESVGRTDLPTGSGRELVESVGKLYKMNGDFNIYCGHGDDNSLEHERKYNAFIREK